ncbi:exported hypothetical protein [Burkholderiales bacterium]|nr:exported hypothetical protein [Burkholderiales bacterium]
MDRRTRIALLIAVLVASAGAVSAFAAEAGDRWRVTSSMTMGSMAMPAHTAEVCAARRPDAAPVKADSNCQVSDVQRVGNRQTLKMHCSGNPPVDSTMEIVYDRPDHYRGQMSMSAAQGPMVVTMEGEKLAGDCDPGAQQRQAQAAGTQMNAQNQQAMKAGCSDSASKLEYAAFLGPMAMCKDADSVKAYCEQMRTHEGFLKLATREQDDDPNLKNVPASLRASMVHPLTGSASLCAIELPPLRAQLCASAESKRQFAFLAGQCPVESRALAQRECSGRDQTTVTLGPYREFCGRYASEQARGATGATNAATTASSAHPPPGAKPASSDVPKQDDAASATDKAKDAATDALNKGTQMLKGLFSH